MNYDTGTVGFFFDKHITDEKDIELYFPISLFPQRNNLVALTVAASLFGYDIFLSSVEEETGLLEGSVQPLNHQEISQRIADGSLLDNIPKDDLENLTDKINDGNETLCFSNYHPLKKERKVTSNKWCIPEEW